LVPCVGGGNPLCGYKEHARKMDGYRYVLQLNIPCRGGNSLRKSFREKSSRKVSEIFFSKSFQKKILEIFLRKNTL
jgi:hypothetical protein